ncbi:hypothetical protein R7736_004584 [Salmonella enterica]|nr:hypothetical protein [Salmonella enterica]
MKNSNQLTKRQELQTTSRRNKQAARQRSLLILRRRRAAFDATKGRILPCPSGWLCSLIYTAQKFAHGTDTALVVQPLSKVVDVVHRRIPHPV